MNSPPPPQPPLSDHLFPLNLDDDPSSTTTTFEWANLLDFTFEDQFNVSWIPDNPTPPIQAFDSVSETSNLGGGGSDSSDKIRKRDPRLTCENFLAGRIPCACPEEDEKDEEGGEIGKKRLRKAAMAIRCQVPGCELDISELKGYHKRHRVCLCCATSSSVLLDGQHKRYCQQCGKFHLLLDFDEGKRSCRRKLERHNKRRRRKPADYRGGGDKENQIDQLVQDIACEDKAEKDESPNESEDGNASPPGSHPVSQSAQSGSIKSFVTFSETQIEERKDNSKDSSSGDNKNAYSSVCPTGRISFKLYDWNPAEFPRRLRHQIFQWLASMPVELEGYIRPGCIILTMFTAMPHFMWEKLSEDASRHIHDFVSAPDNMLFGRGSMTVYLNDMIFRVLKGGTSSINVKKEMMAPSLHYVHPSCFEAGKPMEFVACGSNLLQSKFRFLISFNGQYLTYSDCQAIPYEKTESCCKGVEDSTRCYEHQMYKIHISSTDPTLSGPAFIEVESEFGISNFIPVLFGDKQICSELKMIQHRLESAVEIQCSGLGAIIEPCTGFVSRQTAISGLLLDVGWLLKEPKLDELQKHLTITQIQRFNCLLSFLIEYESASVLMKVVHSIDVAMDTKTFYNFDITNNDVDMKLLLKKLDLAREIVNQRLQGVGEQKLLCGGPAKKAVHEAEFYGEYEMLSAVASSSEDLEKAEKKNPGSIGTCFQQNNEAAPLLKKEVVMNMSYETNPMRTLSASTCTRFLSRRIRIRPRPIFVAVAVSVVCLGVCAVVIHPNKVGDLAVSIHRCLFGTQKT